MKITVLSENTACREDCQAEHGLSLLVETGNSVILFDAGQSDLFARNARVLDADLSEVQLAVLSHGHYDHGGGLGAFLEINSRAPVYVSQYAFEPHYNGIEKYIGLDTGLRNNDRIRYVKDPVTPAEGVTVIPWGDAADRYPVNSFGLSMMAENGLVPDDFRHEQYMLVEEAGRRVLFSGCSHKGILNIVERFRPDVLVGGFHFMKLDPATKDAEQLAHYAEILCGYDTYYYTCHCTGTEQYEYLSRLMEGKLSYLSAGAEIEI